MTLFNFSDVFLACFICTFMFGKVTGVYTSYPRNTNCKNIVIIDGTSIIY